MLSAKISPSLMCADFSRIASQLQDLADGGTEYLHIDVMDGEFVPNIALSECVTGSLRRLTDIPFDYHLMIKDPEKKLGFFDFLPGDLVSVHYESTPHIGRAVQAVRAAGGRAGVALNPATPVECLEYLLCDIDFVLIMTVNPGFAGQKLIGSAIEKIGKARAYLDRHGYPNIMLEVDGNVSFENAEKMRRAGADIFVVGSSSVFRQDLTISEGIKRMRAAVGTGGKDG